MKLGDRLWNTLMDHGIHADRDAIAALCSAVNVWKQDLKSKSMSKDTVELFKDQRLTKRSLRKARAAKRRHADEAGEACKVQP